MEEFTKEPVYKGDKQAGLSFCIQCWLMMKAGYIGDFCFRN